MPDVPLKQWNDWSAGIGHPLDDGQTPGMQYAAGLLGLRGALRAAPLFNSVTPKMGMSGRLDNGKIYAHTGVVIKPAASSTVTFDATAKGNIGNNTELTFAHTCTGANRYLTVGVAVTAGTDPSGVTYNGVAMVKLVSQASGATNSVSIWGLAAPATGANNVVVTIGAAQDISAGAISMTGAHQTTSTGDTDTDSGTIGGLPDFTSVHLTASTGDMGIDAISSNDVVGGINTYLPQTERWGDDVGTVYGGGSSYPFNTSYQLQYLIEEPATAAATSQYLYFFSDTGSDNVLIGKVDLTNGGFATSLGEQPLLGSIANAGQPARYQGNWRIPGGNDYKPTKLTTITTGDIDGDTFAYTGAAFAAGSDHLANLNNQLVGVVEDGTNAGGVRILKVDGTPETSADWGSAFQVGDKTERAAGVRGLEGLSFVSTREGLFSFNSKGRARLVFEDFRSWPNTFANIPLNAFKGGLLITHPSGLQWYVPGELPVGVGVGSDLEANDIPLPGTAELKGGRYHSTSTAGDYVYGIYQADPSSTTALVTCAYTPTGDPRELVHQGLGTVTLLDANHMMACGVAVGSRPLSANYVTPTVWFGNGVNLNYVVLNSRAGPFRTRADTHKVVTSGEAYLSELAFVEPIDLAELVVTTSDMLSDGTDEWKISLITEDGKEKNLGWVKSNGRVPLKIDRHNVRRLVVHVTFTGTSTAARVPPAIKLMQLYGSPAKGQVAA